MRKDIHIPKVEDVSMAIVRETEGHDAEWGVYLLNLKDEGLENILVSSKGYGTIEGEKVSTSELRHFFERIDPLSAIKVERIVEEVFGLHNQYFLTFYIDGLIHDRKFIFVPGSIAEANLVNVPLLDLPGILIR